MDAWGLTVWSGEPPEELFERSVDEYDGFYHAMKELLDAKCRAHGVQTVWSIPAP